jgi:aminotransferase
LKDTNIIVIHDEIYAELTYDGNQHISFAAIPGMWERTITLNGFSKAFAMTGWRLGYAAGPKELMAVLCRIHQYTMLCAPISSQYAGVEALRAGFDTDFADVRRMVTAYDRRRRMLVNGFREAGLECHEPLGAFYVFPSVRSTGLSSDDFCEKLLYSNRVATVPGTAFGKLGEGHIRCSAASSNENIQKALDRIKAFMDTL